MSALTPSNAAKRWKRLLRVVVIVSISVLLVGLWLQRKLKSSYPYGQSHACSKQLGLGLRMYAEDHNGWLPFGGRTPEESLSLACADADPISLKHLMRGKHLPQSVVDTAFAKDGMLSPETCGWHYVEGLRESDSPQLAIAWDKKIGLNHNGRLLKDFQCEIVRLDGSSSLIRKAEWPEFCAEQKQLLAEVIASRGPSDPLVRWSDEQALGPNVAPARTITDGIYRVVEDDRPAVPLTIRVPGRAEPLSFKVEHFREFVPAGIGVFETPAVKVVQIDGKVRGTNWSDEQIVLVANRRPYLELRKSGQAASVEGQTVGAAATLSLQLTNQAEANEIAAALKEHYSLP